MIAHLKPKADDGRIDLSYRGTEVIDSFSNLDYVDDGHGD
jgi:hypothetical protein